MNFSRIVTIATLCSLSGASLMAGILGVFHSQSDHPTPPDGDKNANKPNPKEEKTKAKTQTAIATPEKLPSQLASKTKKQNGSKAASNSPKSLSLTASSTPVVNVYDDPPSSSLTSAPERYQASSTHSTGAIAAPETISASRAVSASQSESASDPSLAFMMPLKDIQGHWAQYYIEDLASKGVIHGFPDGNFRPNQPITPTEFATMTQNAFQGLASAQKVPSYQELQAHAASGVATRADAARFVHQALAKLDPGVMVTNVEVNGDVARPGAYSLAAASDARLGKGNNFPTVTRAIQQAGGSLDSANLHQVEIHRTSDTGVQRVIKVDVTKMLETGDRSQDMVLQQDDKLVIPSAVSQLQPPIAPPEQLSNAPKSPDPVSPNF